MDAIALLKKRGFLGSCFDKGEAVVYCERLFCLFMNLLRHLGAGVMSGALALGACGGSKRSAEHPLSDKADKNAGPQGLSIHERPHQDQKKSSQEKPLKPYLAPPKNGGELMDVLVICIATRESAKAFVQTELQIPSTKGCRIIQAIHEQGERVIEACTPLVESNLPIDLDLMGSISLIRLELDSVTKQLKQLRRLNSHCFDEDIKPQFFRPGTFESAGRGPF